MSQQCTPCQVKAIRAYIQHLKERALVAAAKAPVKIVDCEFDGKKYRGHWITSKGHAICVPEGRDPGKFAYHHLQKVKRKQKDYKPKDKRFDQPETLDEKGKFIHIDGKRVWLKEGASEKHLRWRYRKHQQEMAEWKARQGQTQEELEYLKTEDYKLPQINQAIGMLEELNKVPQFAKARGSEQKQILNAMYLNVKFDDHKTYYYTSKTGYKTQPMSKELLDFQDGHLKKLYTNLKDKSEFRSIGFAAVAISENTLKTENSVTRSARRRMKNAPRYIKIAPKVSEDRLDSIIEAWNALPPKVQTQVPILEIKNTYGSYSYGCNGSRAISSAKIMLNVSDRTSNRDTHTLVTHEAAHTYWSTFTTPEQRAEWKKVCEKYGSPSPYAEYYHNNEYQKRKRGEDIWENECHSEVVASIVDLQYQGHYEYNVKLNEGHKKAAAQLRKEYVRIFGNPIWGAGGHLSARARALHNRLHALVAADVKIVDCEFDGKQYRGHWITSKGHRICVPEGKNPGKWAYHYLDRIEKASGKKKVKRDKFQKTEGEGEWIDIDGDRVWKPEGRKLSHFKYHYRKWKGERDAEDEREKGKEKPKSKPKAKPKPKPKSKPKPKEKPKPKVNAESAHALDMYHEGLKSKTWFQKMSKRDIGQSFNHSIGDKRHLVLGIWKAVQSGESMRDYLHPNATRFMNTQDLADLDAFVDKIRDETKGEVEPLKRAISGLLYAAHSTRVEGMNDIEKKFRKSLKDPPPEINIATHIPEYQLDVIREVWNITPPEIKAQIPSLQLFNRNTRNKRLAMGGMSPVVTSMYVDLGTEVSPQFIRSTFIHELGHVFYQHLATPEQKKEWEAVVDKYGSPTAYAETYMDIHVSQSKKRKMGIDSDIYYNESHSETISSFVDPNDKLQNMPGIRYPIQGSNESLAHEPKYEANAKKLRIEHARIFGTIINIPQALIGSLRARLSRLALTAAATQGKLYVRTFLIDDTRNSMGWRVSWDSIKKHINTFKGKPGIEFTRCSKNRDGAKVCHLDHTQGENYNDATHKQEKYRGSTITDIQLDHKTHTAYAIHRVDDPELAKKIVAGQIKYLSPSVWPDNEGTSRQVKFEKDSAGEWAGQWIIDTTKWRGLHEAWVDQPAYGDKARVTDQCMGTTAGECMRQFNTVHAALTARIQRIRQQLTAAAKDPNIIAWFSTEDGVHIPIRKGQTKNEAFNSFTKEQNEEAAKEEQAAQEGGPADKPHPKIFDPETDFKNDPKENLDVYMDSLLIDFANKFDFDSEENMDQLGRLIDAEYDWNDDDFPEDVSEDVELIYRTALHAAATVGDANDIKTVHNALADMATAQKLNRGDIPYVDRDPSIFVESDDGAYDGPPKNAEEHEERTAEWLKQNMRGHNRLELRKLYADRWRNTKTAYRGVSLEGMKEYLNTKLYAAEGAPPAFSGAFHIAKNFNPFIFAVPKEHIPLEHAGDQKYKDDMNTGDKKDKRMGAYTRMAEARPAADTQIHPETSLYIDKNGIFGSSDEEIESIIKAAKDSGLFKSVEILDFYAEASEV